MFGGWALGKYLSHESRALMSGICATIKKTPEGSRPSCCVRIQGEVCKLGEALTPPPPHCDFQPPELGSSEFLLWVSHLSVVFLLWQPKWTKTTWHLILPLVLPGWYIWFPVLSFGKWRALTRLSLKAPSSSAIPQLDGCDGSEGHLTAMTARWKCSVIALLGKIIYKAELSFLFMNRGIRQDGSNSDTWVPYHVDIISDNNKIY